MSIPLGARVFIESTTSDPYTVQTSACTMLPIRIGICMMIALTGSTNLVPHPSHPQPTWALLNAAMQNELDNLTAANQKLRDENLNREFTFKSDIMHLKRTVQERNAALADCFNQIQWKDQRIADLEAMLHSKDATTHRGPRNTRLGRSKLSRSESIRSHSPHGATMTTPNTKLWRGRTLPVQGFNKNFCRTYRNDPVSQVRLE